VNTVPKNTESDASPAFITDLKKERTILMHYMNGSRLNYDENDHVPLKEPHDKRIVRSLRDRGFLRCGITQDVDETMKTTKDGREYLEWIDCMLNSDQGG